MENEMGAELNFIYQLVERSWNCLLLLALDCALLQLRLLCFSVKNNSASQLLKEEEKTLLVIALQLMRFSMLWATLAVDSFLLFECFYAASEAFCTPSIHSLFHSNWNNAECNQVSKAKPKTKCSWHVRQHIPLSVKELHKKQETSYMQVPKNNSSVWWLFSYWMNWLFSQQID